MNLISFIVELIIRERYVNRCAKACCGYKLNGSEFMTDTMECNVKVRRERLLRSGYTDKVSFTYG